MPTIKQLVFILICAAYFSCGHTDKYTFTTFHSAVGWGYNILSDDRILIHQQNIPGESTLYGFERKEQAERMADLVIQKIKEGKGLPSIAQKEVNEIDQRLK